MKTAKKRTASTRRPQVRSEPKIPFPVQHQRPPGLESKLRPAPRWAAPRYRAAGKLEGKVAFVTGGDSGIGRAVAFLYAREGADVAIGYLPVEQSDALETQRAIQVLGRQCLLVPADLTDPAACSQSIAKVLKHFGRIDVLVSNAAYQRHKTLAELTPAELERTFATNVFACFHLVKAALPHLQPGSAIIATSSETGILGTEELPDYSSTKGALNAFIKTMAMDLIKRGVRANAVAPGPVWTPLNPSDQGRTAKQTSRFGAGSPMGRPAQPEELAPAYVFLASDADSSYITGMVLQVMGGETSGG
jgi:NAD(P)-dependent dehydrogenase (short-subunit alcohol dehydrogenase family)